MEILYKTKFGSHLYGTDTENSDIDYKGIYLPKLSDLVMRYLIPDKKSINYSTGDQHSKNTNQDVDIQYWSLQYWLSLVKVGDTNALDLLFSYGTSHEVVEFCDERMLPFFQNPLKMVNPKLTKAYVSYCNAQAKKYGLKGTRLSILKELIEFLNQNQLLIKNGGLVREISQEILDLNYDKSLCFQKDDLLYICGKAHGLNIKILEFQTRINNEYEKYGHRARLAEQNEGVDWKAVSHAVRCIDQCKEFLETGKMTFPLISKEIITNIKLGNIP